MKISVVYFSRSGYTKSVADAVASKLKLEAVKVEDNVNWSGLFGMIKGGMYVHKNKPVEIKFDKSILDSDIYVVMSPLWAGGPAPAIREFLKGINNNKVCLLMTNNFVGIEKAFENCKSLYPKITKMYGVTKRKKNKDEVVEQLVKDVK